MTEQVVQIPVQTEKKSTLKQKALFIGGAALAAAVVYGVSYKFGRTIGEAVLKEDDVPSVTTLDS